jgi:hypothetical protein
MENVVFAKPGRGRLCGTSERVVPGGMSMVHGRRVSPMLTRETLPETHNNSLDPRTVDLL